VRDGMCPVGKDVGPTHHAMSFDRDELHGIGGYAFSNKALDLIQWQCFQLCKVEPFARDGIKACAVALRVLYSCGNDLHHVCCIARGPNQECTSSGLI